MQEYPAVRSCPIMAAERLGTKKYDLIISTSSAVAKSVPVGKNAKHWCFIHSPMRYVWDRFDDYFGKDKVGAVASNTVFKPVAAALRSYDVATAKRVTHFASNSDFVADRVKRYYQREAETLYAPVELERFDPSRRDPEDFYLYFSALVPYKKADHAIKACMALKKKLIVVGDGPELSQLKSIADEEYVSFRGRVADDEVVRLYSKARALLFPGVEDLGIIPIEANAAGLPVIGYAEGGLTETQTKNTCVFYDEQTVEELISALQTFEEKEKSFKPSQLRKQAEKFAPDAFKERVLASIKSIL